MTRVALLVININPQHTKSIYTPSRKIKTPGPLKAGGGLFDMACASHVKPQKSKPEIRQGKLLPIYVYLDLALQAVFKNEH